MLSAGERSAVRRLAEVALSESLDPVVVVVGAHPGPIAHELRGLSVEIVEAEQWYEGRTASVQAGLMALPADRDILFWPVDHPFVADSTVDTLLRACHDEPLSVWFIPSYQGRGGHPVVWRSSVRADILDLRSDAPLRSLLPEFGIQVHRIAVDDPGVVANVDTPEEYRAALAEWEARGERF